MFGNPVASIGEVAYGFRSLGAEVAAGTRHGAFFVGLGKGLKSLGENTTSGLLGVLSAAGVLASRHMVALPTPCRNPVQDSLCVSCGAPPA